MIFTSLTFIVFFAVVFVVYWRVHGLLAKQRFLLLASAVFYGWWDYRFLALIAVAIATSFLGARALDRWREHRLAVVSTVITLLLTILGIFKYVDFLFDVTRELLAAVGVQVAPRPFTILLPVGISFFTFHGISYIVDVYRGKIPAERSVTKVALYILFFPQLIAGPIVRASNFMPQLEREPQFSSDEVLRGLKLFLIGFMYKAIVSDSIAPYVDEVYGKLSAFGPGDRIMATVGFYAQIYFDFAGYSIMAIGLSRILGYRLPKNFDFPYTSLSVTEFWRRWHISLSTWLRDYLYISLGGNRVGELRQLLNIAITMLLGGLWHGASWNFVAWGALHGLALCTHKLYMRWVRTELFWPVAWGLTQVFVLLCWVPFRAKTFADTMAVWSAFHHIGAAHFLDMDYKILLLILVPLAVDTLFVSGRVSLRIPGWDTVFAGRPWRLALAMGALFGVALLFIPLVTRTFIYFKF